MHTEWNTINTLKQKEKNLCSRWAGFKNLNSVSKEDALLIEILEERYVTFFGQIEGFNDVRRTRKEDVGIKLQPNTGSLLPERFLYPQSEIDSNPNTPSPLPGFFEPTEVNQWEF